MKQVLLFLYVVACMCCSAPEPNCGERVLPVGALCYEQFDFTHQHETINTNSELEPRATSSVASDINGDGFTDVIVGGNNNTTTKLFLGSEDGFLFTEDIVVSNGEEIIFDIESLLITDINQDDFNDLLFIPDNNSDLFVNLNSDLNFTDAQEIASASFGFQEPIMHDFNDDQIDDIFAITSKFSTIPDQIEGLKPDIDIYINQAGVISLFQKIIHPVGDVFQQIAVGDINGDKSLDLVVTRVNLSSIVFIDIFIQINGIFEILQTIEFLTSENVYRPEFPVSVGDLKVSDLNGDSKDDIAITTISGDNEIISVLLQSKENIFTKQELHRVPTETGLLAPRHEFKIIDVVDLDLDSKKDIVILDTSQFEESKRLIVFRNVDDQFKLNHIFEFELGDLGGLNDSVDLDIVMGDFDNDSFIDFFIIGQRSYRIIKYLKTIQ